MNTIQQKLHQHCGYWCYFIGFDSLIGINDSWCVITAAQMIVTSAYLCFCQTLFVCLSVCVFAR